VQNIDLMNLWRVLPQLPARWYREAAEQRGIALSDPAAREIVYGRPVEAGGQAPRSDASAGHRRFPNAAHKH